MLIMFKIYRFNIINHKFCVFIWKDEKFIFNLQSKVRIDMENKREIDKVRAETNRFRFSKFQYFNHTQAFIKYYFLKSLNYKSLNFFRMKKIFFTLLFSSFVSICFSQQVINRKDSITPDGGIVRVVTTPSSERSNFRKNLTPGYETVKIRLNDSINNSNFEIKYYLEEYLNNHMEKKDKANHFSKNSTYVCEIIINRMTKDLLSLSEKDFFSSLSEINDFLSLIIQTPGYTITSYIKPTENKSFKWKIFQGTPFDKNVPIFLIYYENPLDNTLEQKINNLFTSSSFVKLRDKEKIVEQIKVITNHFYLFLYDVINK